MALIKCNECGKEISDKAINCIHCGCPMNNQEKTNDKQKLNIFIIIGIIIFVIILLLILTQKNSSNINNNDNNNNNSIIGTYKYTGASSWADRKILYLYDNNKCMYLVGSAESKECTYYILDSSVEIKYEHSAIDDYYVELTFDILNDGKLQMGYDIYEKNN